jgi:hypothetical protein
LGEEKEMGECNCVYPSLRCVKNPEGYLARKFSGKRINRKWNSQKKE